MKNIYKLSTLLIIILLLVGTLVTNQTTPVRAATGFHVSGRSLLDANNNNFIIRGINHAHTFFPGQTSAVANIKATGANTIRVVLSGGRWNKNSASDVANMINLCKTNKLVCVLDDQDTTGFGEDAGAYSLAQTINYWKELQPVLTGQEAYVIINIGNEPYGNNNTGNWVTETKSAIAALRSAGFQHTLMVDAPNWGQDWSGNMKNNAASVFASDPLKNIVFSVHMYGVYNTASTIQSYIASYVNANLPLVIGEFGDNHSDGNPDENTIMSEAQAKGIGYMGWSWSGNGNGVEYLDMAIGFNPNQLSTWGNRIINGANGIKATSIEASIYGGPTATVTRTLPPSSNLALLKPVTCSSVEAGANICANAVDGNATTRWSSLYADPQWIRVDLGASKAINRVVLRWETAYGKSYQIQTSNDGTNWTTIYTTTTGDGGIDDLSVTGNGRYVRMSGTARGTAWGYSLFEFEVYGPTGPTSTPTATATTTKTSTITSTPTITLTGVITNTPTRTNTPSITITNPPSALKVQYKAGDTNTGDNQARPYFNIINTGTSSVALSGLKIRYYLTENTTQAFTGYCDYAVINCSNVTNTFTSIPAVTGANRYMEVGFTAGNLAAGASTGEIQGRFNKNDWSPLNESDDYSFDATKTAYADWSKVALYNNGTLVWGTPPGGSVATNTMTPTATTTTCPCFTTTPSRTVTPTVPTATVTATPTGPTPTPTVFTGTPTHLPNPFVGGTWYVNREWRGSETFPTVGTFVWMDSIAAIHGTGNYGSSLVQHLDAALAQGANLFGIVIYDLPNRDCSALSSNGELLIANGGTARYKAEYVDVIAEILSRPAYYGMRIVAVIEPDSLPNLITNANAFPKCQAALSTTDGYVANTTYTLNKLYPIRNVYSYIDIAHAGWLGWPNNFTPAVNMIANMVKGTTAGVNSIDGFIDNTANTQVETETFLNADTIVGGNPVRSGSFFDWNPYIDESHYAAAWQTAMRAAGLPASSTNMLIDTSRNGWGGCGGGPFALQSCRPTRTSTSTNLETYINESRIDRRPAKGNWCNQNGAGIGKMPGPGTAPYQWYVWVKPPGESDGSSTLIPVGPDNPDGKGLDGMCDPNYMGNSLNENMNSNALPNAPLSGAWFQAQFDQLLAHKYP